MRRLLLILILVASHTIIQGQDSWRDGCDPRAIDLLEPLSDEVDYGAACKVYEPCNRADESDRTCILHALDTLMEACTDDHCRSTAFLYTTAIIAFNQNPYSSSYNEAPDPVIIEGFPRGITAFQSGDTGAALAAFQPTDPYDFNIAPNLARATVYRSMGQHQQAIEEYNAAYNLYIPTNPLILYGRAQLFGAMGLDANAAFDALQLWELVKEEPALHDLISPLTETYPVGEMENWLFYPVTGEGSGSSSYGFSDYTLSEPTPFRLKRYPELGKILTLGLPLYDDFDVIVFDQNEWFSLPDAINMTGSVQLTAYGDVLAGTAETILYEGYGRQDFLIAPEDAPDPRADIHGSRCGVISRLRPGMQVEFAEYDTQPLIDPPVYGEVVTTTHDTMTVTADRECVMGVLWWKVEVGSVKGWTVENKDLVYKLMPVNKREQHLFYCPDVMPPRLVIGGRARVIPGLGANNVRAQPSADAAIITQISDDFTVLDGPVCADGFVWWKTVSGWTAEGDAENYWLEPA